MIKLLLRILLLALPFAVFLAGFELKYRNANNNEYIVKEHLLEARANAVEILTLGSSHGYYGILPELLGRKAFNLAHVSQTIYYDVELTLKYLPKLPHLRAVVLPISYFSLEEQLDQEAEAWRCYYYYKFYSIPHRTRNLAYDIRNYSLFFLYGWDANIFHDPSCDFDSSGGSKETFPPLTLDEFKKNAAGAIKRHQGGMHPKNLPVNISALEKLAIQLHQRNIRLYLVTTPVTSYYWAGMQTDSYTRMQRALKTFCQDYHATYSNYLADARFTLADFKDADHLNHTGAVKFSRLLAHEVLHSDEPRGLVSGR